MIGEPGRAGVAAVAVSGPPRDPEAAAQLRVALPLEDRLDERDAAQQATIMALVQLGWLISTLLVAYLFSRFRLILSRPRMIPVLFKIFSLAFAYFAADMVFKSVRYFAQ